MGLKGRVRATRAEEGLVQQSKGLKGRARTAARRYRARRRETAAGAPAAGGCGQSTPAAALQAEAAAWRVHAARALGRSCPRPQQQRQAWSAMPGQQQAQHSGDTGAAGAGSCSAAAERHTGGGGPGARRRAAEGRQADRQQCGARRRMMASPEAARCAARPACATGKAACWGCRGQPRAEACIQAGLQRAKWH